MDFDPGYQAPASLPALLRGLLATAHERHMDLIALVSGLPPGGLAWSPGPDAAHISGLAMHILEVEEYLAKLAAAEDVEWAGANGSSMDLAMEERALVARLTAVDARLKAAIQAMPLSRLEAVDPASGRPVGSTLLEDLDHAAMHYGQVQLTRHLFELAHPAFASAYEHWR